MIAIIDYGAGNVSSVAKALKFIGCDAELTSDANTILNADGAILPGVGSFGAAMESIDGRGLAPAIKAFIREGRPFLGICLGLQVLFDSSEESPEAEGLSIFSGSVVRFPSELGLKIPHIGWNSIEFKKECPVFKGLPDNPYVYFVHSYYLNAKDDEVVSATAEYGIKFHAAAWRGNTFATQFHPEKSGEVGLQILRNFAELTR